MTSRPERRNAHVSGQPLQPAFSVTPETVSVRMSEFVVINGGQTIRTLLGSCVGVTLFDARTRVGGLAHIVLPDSRGHSGPPGKFADTAIPALLQAMQRQGSTSGTLEAKFAGGARMFSTSTSMAIGDMNVQAVRNELERREIPIIGHHCGGAAGRRMLFCPASGSVRIEIVGAGAVEI
jgi:chemotaxis protein CheD